MISTEWVTVIAVIGGQAGTILLAADRWVHSQGSQVERLQERINEQQLLVNRSLERLSLLELTQARIDEHLRNTDSQVLLALRQIRMIKHP